MFGWILNIKVSSIGALGRHCLLIQLHVAQAELRSGCTAPELDQEPCISNDVSTCAGKLNSSDIDGPENISPCKCDQTHKSISFSISQIPKRIVLNLNEAESFPLCA